ncbi:MAG: 50S ribosomal protein L6, partial [Jeotgalicoccus sp.]|nr:50S ribosomal protein L6 [Jeotgalicoccus sp.]
MSRVGKRLIDIPNDVTIDIKDNTITVKGPKGELVNSFNEAMTYNLEDTTLEVVRPSESKEHRTVHGTTRALI